MGGGTGHLPGRDVCRDGMFAGTGHLPGQNVSRDGTLFIPGFKTVYMEGETECLPGRDAFHPVFT